MALLELLKQQQAPRPMMGRAAFGIQRPSPRVRLDKFKATLDPRMMEQRNVDVTEDVQTPRENIDLSLDVNKDIPLGHDLPGAGGWSRPSGENMTQGEIARSGQSNSESEITNILAEISGIQGKDYGPRKKGGWKDILLGLGLGALQGAANSDPRGGIGAVLGGALGGGAAGGIGGAVDGSTDNRMRDRAKLDKLYGDYGRASKVADTEMNRKYRQKQLEKIDLEEANRVRDDAFRVEKDKRDYDLKVKTADWKAEDRDKYWEWEKIKETAKKEGKQKDYELAVRKQDEIERNNQVKTDQTERKGMPKNNVPLPPSSITPKTGKTTEAAARAYLGKKLKGDALENAIKTARANGEIQ